MIPGSWDLGEMKNAGMHFLLERTGSWVTDNGDDESVVKFKQDVSDMLNKRARRS